MQAGAAVSMDWVVIMMDADGSHPEETSRTRLWLRWLAFGVVSLIVILTLARLAGLLNTTVQIEADGQGGAFSFFAADRYQPAPTEVDQLHIGDEENPEATPLPSSEVVVVP